MHLFPYFLGCRNRNRRRNSFVRKCCYSNLPVWVGKIRIATISNQTASTCISVSTPSSDTYSYKIFAIFNVIFSSFVSVDIMVYNCASVSIFLGCRNRNRRRNSFVRKCCYSNLPVWVGKIRIATISNQTASTCISVSTPSSDTYSYKIFQF